MLGEKFSLYLGKFKGEFITRDGYLSVTKYGDTDFTLRHEHLPSILQDRL